MFDFFFPTEPFGSQTLRLVAEAGEGGGDAFEIARVCRDIEPGNKASWEAAWVGKAEDTEARARNALKAGHRRTAMRYFFAANQYWRMADVFLTIERNDDKAEYFKKAQACFREAAKLHDPVIEIITVRCGDEEYDGYSRRTDRRRIASVCPRGRMRFRVISRRAGRWRDTAARAKKDNRRRGG